MRQIPASGCSRDRRTLRVALPILAFIVFNSTSAHATDANIQQALKEITDTAVKLCGEVASSGGSNSLKVTGDIKAELGGLTKRLVDLGISGSGEYNSTTYEGVLQTELAAAQQDVRRCNIVIFSSLQEKLIPGQAHPYNNLTALSNEQLRENATRFVASLRRFGAEFEVKDSELLSKEFEEVAHIPRDNRVEIDKKWSQNTLAEETRRNRFQAEYNVRFRSGVISYKEIICERIEFTSPCPVNSESRMIDTGFFGGPNPAGDVADYLDSIIQRLPSS